MESFYYEIVMNEQLYNLPEQISEEFAVAVVNIY